MKGDESADDEGVEDSCDAVVAVRDVIHGLVVMVVGVVVVERVTFKRFSGHPRVERGSFFGVLLPVTNLPITIHMLNRKASAVVRHLGVDPGSTDAHQEDAAEGALNGTEEAICHLEDGAQLAHYQTHTDGHHTRHGGCQQKTLPDVPHTLDTSATLQALQECVRVYRGRQGTHLRTPPYTDATKRPDIPTRGERITVAVDGIGDQARKVEDSPQHEQPHDEQNAESCPHEIVWKLVKARRFLTETNLWNCGWLRPAMLSTTYIPSTCVDQNVWRTKGLVSMLPNPRICVSMRDRRFLVLLQIEYEGETIIKKTRVLGDNLLKELKSSALVSDGPHNAWTA
ncbi:hypothetical protein Hamer_G013481 [Homarus americanus]|uniref:Uncharacterized protein n=1 Tax=Homarus americanus TaxID=6706 RepID=A0A8J5N107_HOMAM|nr:hypothetical protein Hamer_G013481 [Homarus americanus]